MAQETSVSVENPFLSLPIHVTGQMLVDKYRLTVAYRLNLNTRVDISMAHKYARFYYI